LGLGWLRLELLDELIDEDAGVVVDEEGFEKKRRVFLYRLDISQSTDM
jgi:hypothetical protein